MPTHIVRLHRVLRTSPDRVYRSFLEPRALERWLPPFEFTGQVHQAPVLCGAEMSFVQDGIPEVTLAEMC